MRTNLFAHTAPGASFPEFVSVNVDEGRAGVEITVRSPAGSGGTTAAVQLSEQHADELAMALWRRRRAMPAAQ